MLKITSDRKTGKAARLTTFENRWTVETWWDRTYRTFFTQLKDENQYERDPDEPMRFGSSGLNAGSPAWARANHDDLIKYVQSSLEGKTDE